MSQSTEYQYNLDQQIWLNALEKGDLPQTIGVLHKRSLSLDETGLVVEGFCCLGVACRVLGLEPYLSDDYDDYDDYDDFDESKKVKHARYGLNSEAEVLPEELQDRLLLRSDNGRAVRPFKIGDSTFSDLTGANDSGATFQQIAEAIRADPTNFFLTEEEYSYR